MIKNKYRFYNLFILLTAIFIFTFYQEAFSQNVSKVEIKKPKLSLVGCWSAALEIKDGKKMGIVSDYVYEFMRDGTYDLSYIYKPEKKQDEKKTETLFVIEIGKWMLTDGGKTLKLEKDTLATKGINFVYKAQPQSLGNAQIINLEDFQSKNRKKIK